MRGLITAALLWLWASAPALAVLPSEQLADPTLEARAVKISSSLRCVVCQNQTIDDSDAPLAHDLRILLRERLVAGDTDAQAVNFIVARYGHYVLLRPPFELWTLLLWLGPPLVLIGGGYGVLRYLKDQGADLKGAAPSISPEDQVEIDRLLKASESL